MSIYKDDKQRKSEKSVCSSIEKEKVTNAGNDIRKEEHLDSEGLVISAEEEMKHLHITIDKILEEEDANSNRNLLRFDSSDIINEEKERAQSERRQSLNIFIDVENMKESETVNNYQINTFSLNGTIL